MILQSKKVFISGQFIPAQIVVEKGIIVGINPYGKEKSDEDYDNMLIVPGFIDVHTHGMSGYSADDISTEGLIRWQNALPSEGVTSFLPTTTTQNKNTTIKSLENIAKTKIQRHKGAQIIGVHLEGPFLDGEYRGMHMEEHLRVPSIKEFEEYQSVSNNLIKYITIACEHDEDFSLIKYASQKGVTVSIGHSGADFENAMLALANGATCFTHSFNAMKPLHHRNPGVVGALLSSNAFVEVIADGHHVHPNVIKILFNSKNMSNVIIVTDSIGVKGLPKGVYEVSNTKVTLDEYGTARTFGKDTIAGSSLKMNEGVRLLVEQASVSIEHAIMAATLTPARALGIEDKKGQIKYQNHADFTVLNTDFSVVATYCMGEQVF